MVGFGNCCPKTPAWNLAPTAGIFNYLAKRAKVLWILEAGTLKRLIENVATKVKIHALVLIQNFLIPAIVDRSASVCQIPLEVSKCHLRQASGKWRYSAKYHTLKILWKKWCLFKKNFLLEQLKDSWSWIFYWYFFLFCQTGFTYIKS